MDWHYYLLISRRIDMSDVNKPTIKVTGPNIGCCTILGLIFVTLKLCNVIDWSWWIVLLPFYGPIMLFFIVGSIICGVWYWLFYRK